MRRSAFAASLVVLLLTLATAASVRAGHVPVDPSTLTPEPPAGADCRSTGTAVRCASLVDASYADRPELELPCGVVYATATDIRTSIRWYEDGLLVRRQVHATAEGVWTLSPTGSGPTVTFVTHTGWGEDYLVPGDLSSAVGSQQGTDFLVRARGGGVLFQVSGQTHGEERFTGRFLVPDDPDVAAALCAALTA